LVYNFLEDLRAMGLPEIDSQRITTTIRKIIVKSDFPSTSLLPMILAKIRENFKISEVRDHSEFIGDMMEEECSMILLDMLGWDGWEDDEV